MCQTEIKRLHPDFEYRFYTDEYMNRLMKTYFPCKNYPEWKEEANFDLKKYCMETLNYSKCIDRFNNSIDILLIP